MAAPAATAVVRRCCRLADSLLGVRRRGLKRPSTNQSIQENCGRPHSSSTEPAAAAAARRCCRATHVLLGLNGKRSVRHNTNLSTQENSGRPQSSTTEPTAAAAARRCCRATHVLVGLNGKRSVRHKRQRSERWRRARLAVAAAVVAAGITATADGRRPSSDPRLIAEMQLSQELDKALAAAQEGDERRADVLLESAVRRAQRAGARAGVLSALDMRATLAQRRGDAAQAEHLAKSAIAFALVRLGLPRDHPEVLSWVLKLARLYSEQRRDEEAERAFQRCEALCRPHALPALLPAAQQPLAVLWVSLLFWHGYFLATRERFSEAAAKLEESYRAALCAPAASTAPEQRLVILFHLADALQYLGRHADAIRYLQNAVSLDCKPPNADVAICYIRLGKLLALVGQEEAAASFCEMGRRLAARARNSSLMKEARSCVQSLFPLPRT